MGLFQRIFINVQTPHLLKALVLLSCIAFTVISAMNGVVVGAFLFAAIIGVFFFCLSIIDFRFGFYLSMLICFFIFVFTRYLNIDFPVGWIFELFVFGSLIGLLVNKIISKKSIFEYTNVPITWAFFAYVLFIILEIGNTNMSSMVGWLLFFRRVLMMFLLYIICLHIFDSYKHIYRFITIWLLLTTIAAFYACYQHWFGYLNFEENWILASKLRSNLYLLVGGVHRQFSLYSDPAALGIDMAATSVLVFPFILRAIKPKNKILFFLLMIFYILAMVYSGTRTSYFMILASVILYVFLTGLNRSTLIFLSIFILSVTFIMLLPVYSNSTINRLRTTFSFSEDASLNLRDVNRNSIQPYIYEHPFGGGINTSGGVGLDYNPGHRLAGFPPDSGLLKSAIETGWIGLLVLLVFYFVILRTGIISYFKMKRHLPKMILISAILCIFSLVIGQYAQEAIGQVPGCYLFCAMLAIISRISNIKTNLS